MSPSHSFKFVPIERRYQTLTRGDMGFSVGSNIEFVVENSLCHGCGTCEAACPQDAIELKYEERRGIYLPEIDTIRCDDCAICVQTCPGFELDLKVKPISQVGLPEHPLIGPFEAIYRCYTNDTGRRSRAASGGMITEVIAYLMERGEVDGAIVTRMSHENPLRAEAYIANTPAELLPSQKSKYCPVPLNGILKQFVRGARGGKYAFVGLPHHVHGLRLLQRGFPYLQESIPIVISSFTAHVPSQHATEFILYKNRIRPEDVQTIEYRGGGNPGRMRIVTKNGGERLVPHLHWTYSGHTFPLFFYPVREWLYFDKLSEWADLSMGDNWMRGLREQKGASTVVVRSNRAHRLIKRLESERRIVSAKMTTDDLVKDQVLTKKLNIYWRLKIWKALGRTVPVYTRTFDRLPGQRLRTLRFASFIMLEEHKVPFWVMDLVIKADYFLRAAPKRVFKTTMKTIAETLAMFLPASRPLPAKQGKYKVVLIGGFGYYDIGDEAMPHAIRNRLRERLGSDLEIVMLSPDPECTFEMHGERSARDFTLISHTKNDSFSRKCVSVGMTVFLLFAVLIQKYLGFRFGLWPSARSALDEISSSDLVFNVGGGNINSVIPAEFYKKTTTYNVASMLRKPVYVSGQTMGPFYAWFHKQYARHALNKVRMISFRDKAVSRERLAEIAVSKPIMFDAADDAISLRGIGDDESRALLERETGRSLESLKENVLVVLNMKASLSLFKGKGRSADLTREVEIMAKLADELVEQFSCNVVLMPTDFSGEVDDRVPHAQIYQRVQNKGSVFQVTDSYVDDELIGMIGLADVAIGARYHFNVFAASRCIPFLGIASGIYQQTKLQGLARLCGLDQCYVDHDLEYAEITDIWPYVETVIKERCNIGLVLKDRIPKLKERSTRVADEAADYLQSHTS
ncbi:coenzyme F420 hydrogenase/dehydrogenase beta subunit N-terminal domain-containing protein [Pseudomonadota bacterium]